MKGMGAGEVHVLSRTTRAGAMGAASLVFGTLGHLEADGLHTELHLPMVALAVVAAYSFGMGWLQSRRPAAFLPDVVALTSNQFVIHVGLVIAMIRRPGAFHAPGSGSSELTPWEVLLPNPEMSGAHFVATLLTAATLTVQERVCGALRRLLHRIAALVDLTSGWQLPATAPARPIAFTRAVRRTRIVGVAPGRGPPAYAH